MSDITSFQLENTTVWSVPERGTWYTHNPSFRGNFAPQIARNIILRYSQEGDTVLDPMVGGGTTLIETKPYIAEELAEILIQMLFVLPLIIYNLNIRILSTNS